MTDTLQTKLRAVRRAARFLRTSTDAQRRDAVFAIANAIDQNAAAILSANEQDMQAGTALPASLQDRLRLTESRLADLSSALRNVAGLDDPLRGHRDMGKGPSGITVQRMRIPLGVIGIIYEARPNVTAECAALCLRSGNAVVLRGGKEAVHSNTALAECLQQALQSSGFPAESCVVLAKSSRAEVQELLRSVGEVDLVIPRGGEGLMNMVDEYARVPVIRHGQGICQVYIDEDADLTQATNIAFDAKVDRPGVCNAMETLLVHRSQLPSLMAALGPSLTKAGVELRADSAAAAALDATSIANTPAQSSDWSEEFLGPVLAIRTVDSLDEALDHIDTYGTHHSAAIVTTDEGRAQRFLRSVDAACVLWNASTRFNDGGQLGLGAEMGISTSKMHAYGPMALMELTAEKFVVLGEGHTRGPGVGPPR